MLVQDIDALADHWAAGILVYNKIHFKDLAEMFSDNSVSVPGISRFLGARLCR